MRKLFLMIFLLAVAGGCASGTFGTRRNGPTYEDRLNKHIGQNVNDIITTFGPPTSQMTMPNGNVAYTWDKGEEFLGERCRTTYYADPKSYKIVAWHYDGAGCENR